MSNIETHVGIRMQNTSTRYPSFKGRAYARPTWTAALTATPEHSTPHQAQPVAETTQRPQVMRYSMVSVVAVDHTFQPFPNRIDWFMQALTELRLDGV